MDEAISDLRCGVSVWVTFASSSRKFSIPSEILSVPKKKKKKNQSPPFKGVAAVPSCNRIITQFYKIINNTSKDKRYEA